MHYTSDIKIYCCMLLDTANILYSVPTFIHLKWHLNDFKTLELMAFLNLNYIVAYFRHHDYVLFTAYFYTPKMALKNDFKPPVLCVYLP